MRYFRFLRFTSSFLPPSVLGFLFRLVVAVALSSAGSTAALDGTQSQAWEPPSSGPCSRPRWRRWACTSEPCRPCSCCSASHVRPMVFLWLSAVMVAVVAACLGDNFLSPLQCFVRLALGAFNLCLQKDYKCGAGSTHECLDCQFCILPRKREFFGLFCH